jgi:hypothetical protein
LAVLVSTDTDQPRADLVYGEPIDHRTVEEVAQLLGYEPRDVVAVHVEARRITVTTTHLHHPADLRDVVHVHVII